jgi:DNA-binding protein YbaB
MDEPAAHHDPGEVSANVADGAAALSAARSTAASSDGLVTVTVDGTGRVVGLELASTAMRKSSDDLAALLLQTIGHAQDDAREQSRQHLAELAPPLPTGAELTDTLQALQQTASTRLAEMSATLNRLLDRTEGGLR